LQNDEKKNMRPNPQLPLIVETDANKRAVVQEITAKGGSREKALIYAA
jgi:hypothetical protein